MHASQSPCHLWHRLNCPSPVRALAQDLARGSVLLGSWKTHLGCQFPETISTVPDSSESDRKRRCQRSLSIPYASSSISPCHQTHPVPHCSRCLSQTSSSAYGKSLLYGAQAMP